MARDYTFSIRLRRARSIRGMTQRELARRAKMHNTAVSHYESGHAEPSLRRLKLLADALMISADYLIGRADEHGKTELSGLASEISARDREVFIDIVKIFVRRRRRRRAVDRAVTQFREQVGVVHV
jgi:transcriptional regulator with XRE-family HTH domain